MKQQFFIVDVFAEHIYSGNPLAVVMGEEELPNITMQKIAADINFSETTFVRTVPENNGGYPVRIYTPSQEIAFAGHPILGTAYILRHYLAAYSDNVINLNLRSSSIPVTFESSEEKEVVWFNAPVISLGKIIDREPVSHALNIAPEDIASKTPIQVASAGTSAIIVPLRSLDALHRCKLSLEKFAPLKEQGLPPLTYLFTEETHNKKNDLCVRFFFEAHGVREDPATGNGAAFLGAYLLEHNYYSKTNLFLRIEQGHEIHRPSLVMLRANVKDRLHDIRVGGYVVPSVKGELV